MRRRLSSRAVARLTSWTKVHRVAGSLMTLVSKSKTHKGFAAHAMQPNFLGWIMDSLEAPTAKCLALVQLPRIV